MTRQTKFRGKRKDTGEWVYGDLLHIDGGCLIYFGSQTETETPYIENSSPIAVELFKTEIAVVEPESVGQFTGLLDANKKEIYEGDVVQTNPTPHGRGYVRWHDKEAHFVVQMLLSEQWYGIAAGVVEICGSIHDTPELLK